jgi:hypothetical protein
MKLSGFAFIALAAAGAAVAAAPRTHRMDVPLPDGSMAHIDYVGDVAPKVTVAPAPLPGIDAPWAVAMPSFGNFARMFQQIERQSQELARQAQMMTRQAPGGAPGLNVAAYANAPAGVTSTTVVSVSNGGGTCTRTTESVSQGPGKPPRVTTNVSGQCASAPAGAAESLSRT